MVDFAGWEMPIQYSTIIEEHQAVRTAAGLFDISHMGRLAFAGPDALDLIQHVYTNNAATLKEGQVRYGLVCNLQGGIRDDVLVYRWPSGYAMVVNASNRPKIVSWLAEHRGQRRVEVHDQTRETCMVAVQGPRALELCRGLTPLEGGTLSYYHGAPTLYHDAPCLVSRTGYTGEDGLEFIVPAERGLELWTDLVGRGAKPCGLGARDTLRLEAAMPLYGHELSEEIDPFQAGLEWAVKINKGEFLGREALERRRQDPTLPRRVGLELDGKRLAREGAVVRHQEREVGRVSSGTFAPTLARAIAMAYVTPALTAPGTTLEVDVRGKPAPARVVPLPFYKRRPTDS
ncbi:MAG: glycine cleavage system aminomethyltransferase GcvT [Planctomycetes bacterium]|nr:glycine cleavage system aminomethyltransferase GcvT [Planctomycetota bacterium]